MDPDKQLYGHDEGDTRPDKGYGPQIVGARLSNKRSGSELQMESLETEIMQLDELTGMLIQRLHPVLTEEEMADSDPGNETKERMPQSPVSQSLREKTDRIKAIKRRVQSILNKLDI